MTRRSGSGPHGRRRGFGTAALLLALNALALPPSSAAIKTVVLTEIASHKGCHSGLVLVEVPKGPVEALVPDRYTVKSDNGETTYVRVDPFACESVKVGGSEIGPVRWAVVSAEICPRSGPEALGCNGVEEYLLFLPTDSEAYATWLRGGTGLDVTHVTGLVYDFERRDVAMASYLFEVPLPSPAAFVVRGQVGAQTAAPVPISEAQWFFQDTPVRDRSSSDGEVSTVTFRYGPHEDFFAPADVTITAEEGSKMAEILSSSEAKPALAVPHWIPAFELTRT